MGLSGWDFLTLASSVTMSSALEVEFVLRSLIRNSLEEPLRDALMLTFDPTVTLEFIFLMIERCFSWKSGT